MLLDNSVDKDFQMMLLPLNILEFVYCQPKFHISHAFVTPNGTRGKIHLILGVVLLILATVGNVFINDFVRGNFVNEALFNVRLADAVFYIVSCILVSGTHLVQADKNVQLVIKMQKAFRVLRDTNGLKKFQRGNWIFVVTFFLSYLLYNLGYMAFDIFKITHCVYNMILFYFDVTVIVAVRIVKFLEYEMILWRKELDRFLIDCMKTNHEQLVKYLVEAREEERRLFSAYSNIIEAFNLCPGVFGMAILVLMVEGFGHPLIYIQFVLDINKYSTEESQIASRLSLLVSFVWIAKTFTLLGWLCVSCQRFNMAVADVDASCALIGGDDGCLVYVHRLSKNVLRYSECVGARDAMRPYNLVSVDASTPLHLLMLLGTYIVVLLQFAFL